MITTIYSDPDFLEHHGVKGMKWGVRRYQNYDGTRITDNSRQNQLAKQRRLRQVKQKQFLKEVRTDKRLSKEQKKLIKDTVTADSYDSAKNIVASSVSKSDIKELEDKWAKCKELSSKVDWDEVTKAEMKYEAEYFLRGFEHMKENDPVAYEMVVKDAKEEGFDPLDHKVSHMYVYNTYTEIEPHNRLYSKEEAEWEKAWNDYYDSSRAVANKMLSSYANREFGNLDTYYGTGEQFVSDVIDELVRDKAKL